MFATIFAACTYAACNGYVIDTAPSAGDCHTNLSEHSERFAQVWAVKNSPDPLDRWLAEFRISESADELTDYDFTCEYIPDDQIP